MRSGPRSAYQNKGQRVLSQYRKKRHQINTKNYWKYKRRLCVKLFEVTSTTWENLQIAKHRSVQCSEWTTDLWVAICRFSQVALTFVTSNNLTHNFLFLFPIVFGIYLFCKQKPPFRIYTKIIFSTSTIVKRTHSLVTLNFKFRTRCFIRRLMIALLVQWLHLAWILKLPATKRCDFLLLSIFSGKTTLTSLHLYLQNGSVWQCVHSHFIGRMNTPAPHSEISGHAGDPDRPPKFVVVERWHLPTWKTQSGIVKITSFSLP